MRTSFLLSALFVLTSPVSAQEEVRGRSSAIVDGELVEGSADHVVAVLNRFGGLCSGTLVAPRIVLTAKHCVQVGGAEGPSPASAFTVGIGDSLRGLSQQYAVSDIVTTPGVYRSGASGLSGALVGIDVAVVTLATVPGIEHAELYREDPLDLIGETLTAIGFGETPAGRAGVKYETTTQISTVYQGVIYTPPTICQGDSGGPLFAPDGTVVGVSSFGSGACGAGSNGFNSLVGFYEMVDDATRASGVCVGDGEEVCDSADNDCDDQVDEDCIADGDDCQDDADCLSLNCTEDGSEQYCTRECDPLHPEIGCPTGMFCSVSEGCAGRCLRGEVGSLGNLENCEADTDCASLRCADPGDGQKRCLEPCEGELGACLDGEVCAANPGSCNGCVPAEWVLSDRGLGEPCETGEECRSGNCLEDRDATYCSRDCADDEDCPSEYHCRADACVRGRRGGIGAPCVQNGDCAAGSFCATLGEVSWCTSFCTPSGEECPESYECQEAGGASICVPVERVLGDRCVSDDECISGVCEALGVTGEQICTRECSADLRCGPGFTCDRIGEAGEPRCVPTLEPEILDDEGCTAGGTSAAPRNSLAFLVLFLVPTTKRIMNYLQNLSRAGLLMMAGLLLSNCAAPTSSSDVAPGTVSIVDGRSGAEFEEVVYLLNFANGGACTGTLISPRVVLTAKHCVDNGRSAAAAPSQMRVFTGSSGRAATGQFFVSEVRPAPGRWDIRDQSDVAILILAAPISNITPREVSFDDPRSLVGSMFRAVGYGQTPSGSSGTKLTVEKLVQFVMGNVIFVTPAVCSGDSGGPLIGPDGRIYGVASFIFDSRGGRPTCGTADGAYNGIMAYQSFIEEALEDSGACVPSEEVCNGADDNCDGTVDEGCTALGETCAGNEECVGETCRSVGSIGQICTQTCNPNQPAVGCPPSMYCARETGGCAGFCAPGGAGATPLEGACTADTECTSLYCDDPGDGRRRCMQPCTGDAGLCLAGEVCAAPAGACGGCVPAGLVAGARGRGEACATNEECQSGLCFDDGGNLYCSQTCENDEGCTDNFHCRAGTCVLGPREGVGGGCVTNEDCGSGICAAQGDRRWCTADCSSSDCPSGLSCQAVGEAMICVPDLSLVGEACTNNEACASGLCAGTPAGQVCTRFCGGDQPCSSGFECVRVDDSTNVCIAVEVEEEDDSSEGCACRVGPQRSDSMPVGGLVFFGALGAVWMRRRR